MEAVGKDIPLSDGGKLLLERLQDQTDEPLWVLAWGGTNVLAILAPDIFRRKRTSKKEWEHVLVSPNGYWSTAPRRGPCSSLLGLPGHWVAPEDPHCLAVLCQEFTLPLQNSLLAPEGFQHIPLRPSLSIMHFEGHNMSDLELV
jgi:hypothetical protein